jgi:hypothetical protein
VASFLATYLAALPEARGLEPRELQRAVAAALEEMRRGRVRRLFDWGRFLYRTGTVAYGGVQLFTNPWLAHAVLRVLWAAARFVVGK